jgi:hypothetical protein
MLLELHLRLHALGSEAFGMLGTADDPAGVAEAWPGLLDHFIEQVLSHRELFLLHERNHSAFEQLERSEHHQEQHDDLEQQLRRFLSNPAIPLPQRVRMACSIGAVMSVLMGSATLFGDVPTPELAALVSDAVGALLVPTDAVNRPRPARRPPRSSR